MADVVLKNINKIYDNNVQAVFDFNLDIKDGEFIVLVGPSGCGKSTTLRMIAGLENISSGDLIIDGRNVNNEAAKDRDIAMVFQNYALYAHMSVYHNMAFSLMIRRTDPHEIHRKVMQAAEILELTTQLNKKPRQLSGGQRQRVALGRAIVRNPKVFLLDEPLSNLDAKLRGSMRRELALLHKRLAATMIYVTHDQVEALTLATRIVIMNKGYVQQIGTPDEVYHDPANIFVASFIGMPPMNLIDVVVDDTGMLSSVVPGIRFLLPEARFKMLKKANYLNQPIVFGIRPENIRQCQNGEAGLEFTGSIFEPLGANTLIHCNIGEVKMIVKLTGWYKEQNQLFKVYFDPERMLFFDQKTGLRIRGDQENE